MINTINEAIDAPGGLVVDVEVSGCVAQHVHRLYNGAAVEGENRAGQRENAFGRHGVERQGYTTFQCQNPCS